MTVQYATGTRNARMDRVTTDAGAAAFVQFWNGTVPATPATAPGGTLLASCAMANPVAPAASGGVWTASAIASDTNANASGTPTFCRIATSETGTTTGIAQFSSGIGSGDVQISAAIVATGTVAVSSLVITEGNA